MDKNKRLYCAGRLEHFGFKRSVAGDDDFGNAVAAYYTMSQSTEPIRKGIIAFGKPGCGKTTFLRAVTTKTSIPCHFFSLARHEDMMLLDAHGEYERDFMARLIREHVVLDDVGAESSVTDYGVKYDVVKDFIMRYNDARERVFLDEKDKPHGRLFISTNFNSEQLVERYGARVLDRIKNLCIAVQFHGKSKRKTTFIGFAKPTPDPIITQGTLAV